MRCSCITPKEELKKANEDNIQSHFKEFRESVTNDVLEEIKKSFKQSFK